MPGSVRCCRLETWSWAAVSQETDTETVMSQGCDVAMVTPWGDGDAQRRSRAWCRQQPSYGVTQSSGLTLLPWHVGHELVGGNLVRKQEKGSQLWTLWLQFPPVSDACHVPSHVIGNVTKSSSVAMIGPKASNEGLSCHVSRRKRARDTTGDAWNPTYSSSFYVVYYTL